MFVKFFENESNAVFQFQVQSYLNWDKVFDSVLDDLSIFFSTMLRKITAYKTFVFIKYLEDFLEESIKQNLEKSSALNKGI